jgi:hypothetical protein
MKLIVLSILPAIDAFTTGGFGSITSHEARSSAMAVSSSTGKKVCGRWGASRLVYAVGRS